MDNSKLEKIQQNLWPHIYDLNTAKKAAMQGVWISLLIMAINTVVILINNSYWSFVDVAMVGILAFGIFKMSRVAAVLAIIFYLAGQVYYIMEHGKSNYIMMAIITMAFISSNRGVFAHHKIKQMAE